MLWFALILPDLPLQAFTRGVDDAGVLAVVEHHPRQRVIAATPAAQVRGVTIGGSVTGALAVAPELNLRPRDIALETATLTELASWAGQFTPGVSLAPPDAVLLETSSSLRLFGGATVLAQRIRQELPRLGLNAHLAAAPTPLAACWLARTQPGKLVHATPDWWRCLDNLSVELLTEGGAVSSTTLELLQGIGAHSIGDAARLPRDGLARRQAGAVSDALARARGERPDPRLWFVPAARFESRLALPASVANTETLLFAARRLFASLSSWLATRHAALDRCWLHLEHEDGPETQLEIITGHPSRDEARLVLLAREHLAALKLPGPVEALRLSADAPLALSPRTTDLFGDPGAARESASLLLDRLRARLGRDTVRTVHPVPEHRPERAWRPAEPGTRPAPIQPPAGARPLWLLDAPRELGSIRRLTLLSGPERIESGWWDGADIRRDYYVAHAQEAGLWWIFKPLDASERWYVHGYFG